MKFDTPATTNPIDQLKVVGKPTNRIDGPLKTTGTAPYAYERHDVVPNQAYGYVVGAGDRQGPDSRRWICSARQGGARRARHRHGGECRQARQGRLNIAKLLGGPEIEHYHQAIARRRGRDLRAGARRSGVGPRRL